MTRIALSSVAAAAVLASASTAFAQTEIQFWHAMGGNLGETVNALAEGFNKSQTEYKVNPVYKGSYTEALTAAIAAFRAKQAPHIVQVFEVGTANMMAAKGAVYPVYQLMADAKEPFDPKAFIGPVYGYYSTPDGKLLSMPFNSSTPVLYWNKELMQKAGLDPNKPPKTWPELGEMAKKAVAAGAKCGFTPQWQTWTMIENYGAWHNLPYATKDNGFAGTDIELKFNDPARVKFIQMLADWTKDKTFVYGGREGKSTALFTAGDCVFHIASSGSAAGIDKALGQDKVGIGMMPYSPDVIAKPQNSIIGGATLWVLQGRPAAEYKGVAKFMSYLASTPVQAKWHQETGYVPITMAAAEATEKEGFYKKFPGREVAVQELTLNPPTANSKGLRIGNFVQIRDIVDGELENVWSGKKDAKTALDDAVKAGNDQLKRFEAANK
ncbi:sn-glycerol-3-phosphate ABC transporter substrate-binding protein UgpB [Reyranella sp.]|jgi:sn-glycerol 3-phosphate transport system substrate-binding protein|uniref:sn-glycerol-3-phosphate ABC transporter substrate-binding protein UgpB n=1 Tax=Reyranella sp. TaxID=1929291 RepID=UPI000BC70475|nr:sn-glycerol-3-phosphate ABC transporter substrate-binding protein UgpB [Reyranella sp.]OYY42363.1 MAG: sn-glycerol-3-phosphate ABC transporter substrate-binding protein [Rhodospirillales bacterium 35-66-84]OYZ94049.1 MAG: sn-glycerol-3-phosphate ABC transporter substrate-binding protein [Rhodospirillales bacterium 24-66-33]OZB22302.1 MAG: sn-glycerol-3-phosphate ABC transporter substrate-binding protein [Rhodospirillales bacterium 39-66-50]HQS17582.1 sn-glycerol-3-phosphate ABC transporter s